MHQLIIDRLGPITHCKLSVDKYTVITGYQASGKSTIAKALYFFRTIKDDIYQLLVRRQYNDVFIKLGNPPKDNVESALSEFERDIRNKFLSTFGSSYSMDRNMRLSYNYCDGVSMGISLREGDGLTPNYVWVKCSGAIREFIKSHDGSRDNDQLRTELNELFDDAYETVYIPAGRSVLTLLGSQFEYFYSTMDDKQKRLLDACTKDYVERVMRLRPQFDNGLEGLLAGESLTKKQKEQCEQALSLIGQILKGRYIVAGGEERILMDEKHYVKINFASSGQQEVVWILNLLFYYLAANEPVFYIIEEPESNLFPESQKTVMELVSLVVNAGSSTLVTTHSPYVLGTVNNLIYAGTVGKKAHDEVNKIIPDGKWIDSNVCTALFVRDGIATNCMDHDLLQIDNSLLDEISHGINREYDALFEVEQSSRGEK